MRKFIILVAILLGTAVSLTLLFSNLQAAPNGNTYNTTDTLYDPSQQNTPADQTFEYAAVGETYVCATPPFICANPPQVTHTYSSTISGTVFNSMDVIDDYAGYAITPTLAPTLTRATGFKLDFALNIREETHNNNDRAGFVVILLAEDMKGIEVSFWKDEIWVQEDNDTNSYPMFTHAEGVSYTTTSWTDYELEIISDTYTLSANTTEILSGTIRDYTAWDSGIPGAPDPYETPNLIFFGDNSSNGRSQTWIRDITIHYNTDESIEYNIYLPMIIK